MVEKQEIEEETNSWKFPQTDNFAQVKYDFSFKIFEKILILSVIFSNNLNSQHSTFQVEIISESSLQGRVYEAVLIHGNFIKSVYQEQVDDKVLATDLIYFQFSGNSFMERYNLTLDFKLNHLDVPKVKIDRVILYCGTKKLSFSFNLF